MINEQFNKFLIEEFFQSEEWALMKETVEDSQWHREPDVSVHTLMVLNHYVDHFLNSRTETENKIALLALLFHDTGKPEAEEELERADGSGKYRRYAGHESVSSHCFMEYYLKSPTLKSWLTVDEARAIRWIIEYHLPYGYKQRDKVHDLKLATELVLKKVDCTLQTFYDCLRSDANGRISDDHATKLQNVEDWIANFDQVRTDWNQMVPKSPNQKMYILVGPSGSGKSTFTKSLGENVKVINEDQMKMDLFRSIFPEDQRNDFDIYDDAWQYCTMDHKPQYTFYRDRTIRDIVDIAKKGAFPAVVDVVNSSKKRRAQFVSIAKQQGFEVEIVEFWVPLDVLQARQETRGDKRVPVQSVKKQYDAIQLGWVGSECYSVKVVMNHEN